MDSNLTALLIGLVGPTGIGGLAYVLRQTICDRHESAPAETADRTAGALDAVLDELVESRTEHRALRMQVWECSVAHCPVRDHLRTGSAT